MWYRDKTVLKQQSFVLGLKKLSAGCSRYKGIGEGSGTHKKFLLTLIYCFASAFAEKRTFGNNRKMLNG